MPQLSQQGQDSNTRALDFEHEYHDPKTFKVKPENADPLRYSQYACDLVDTLIDLEPKPLSNFTKMVATGLHKQVTDAAPVDRESFRGPIDDVIRTAWLPYHSKIKRAKGKRNDSLAMFMLKRVGYFTIPPNAEEKDNDMGTLRGKSPGPSVDGNSFSDSGTIVNVAGTMGERDEYEASEAKTTVGQNGQGQWLHDGGKEPRQSENGMWSRSGVTGVSKGGEAHSSYGGAYRQSENGQ